MNILRLLSLKRRVYEYAMGSLAFGIVGLGVLAWYFGTRSWDAAVRIAEPVLLGLGTLSIVLLWAQFRESNIWNRLISYHQFFSEVPSPPRAQLLMRVLSMEPGIEAPPSAYQPLSTEQVERIWSDKGDNGRPPAKEIVRAYLNDFEHFCGAINVGLVDEEYARELRGTRVIDAYFAYAEAIVRIRKEQEDQAETRVLAGSPEPFTSKYYLELQRTATRWHERRRRERELQQQLVEAANTKADRVRAAILRGAERGVPAIAKDRSCD
jgi:hypothetical protein